MTALISLRVAADSGEDLQTRVCTRCTTSTRGWPGEQPCCAEGAEISSAQRSSMAHPMVADGKACRSAATAGRLWMMSPIALMRVMRIRFHGGWERKRLFSQNLAARVVFWVANNLNPAAALDHDIAFGDAFCRIVGTLGVDVRANFADQGAGIGFRKNYHRIHIAQRRQKFGTLTLGRVRTALALQHAHRCVRVQADNNSGPRSQLFGRTQTADMADVKQIEAAVGQHNTVAGGPPRCHLFFEFLPTEDFLVVHA